jgi:3-oxocholest-4-en-26-oate---CoA ligase
MRIAASVGEETMPGLDLVGLHSAIAASQPDKPSVITDDRIQTWRETVSRGERLGRFLLRHGLGRVERFDPEEPWRSNHQHLGIYLRNGLEYLEAVLGAHYARMAPFNINYRYTESELVPVLQYAAVDVLVFGAEFSAQVEAAVSALSRRPLLIAVGDPDTPSSPPHWSYNYDDLPLSAGSDQPASTASPDDLHLLLTGGTTGFPRAVLWRVGDLIAGPLGVRERDGTPITDVNRALDRARSMGGVVLSAAPFMHGAGLWFALGGWLSGASVVIPPVQAGFDAAQLLRSLRDHEVTSLMIVGDAFAAPLVNALRDTAAELPALRSIINSGAPLREQLARALEERLPDAKLIDMLGSSETGQQATRTVGKPFKPRGDTVVLDEQRQRILPPGSPEAGWLAKGGPIPLGYLDDPERTKVTFPIVAGHRFAISGDRARILADHSIELLGRDSTTVNSGGEKVFVEEVEAVLTSIEGISDALVVGRPSEIWGSELAAVISTDIDVSDAELRDLCADHLARYKIPKVFHRVPQVPRHPNGKPDYAEARRLLKDGSS